MSNNDRTVNLAKLKVLVAEVVRRHLPMLPLTMLEIGARPTSSGNECFHELLGMFPNARVIAFEVDQDICDELNHNSPPGIRYYPQALGRTEEERPFYVTNSPLCCSLYKPNEELLERFNNMEMAMLKSVSTIKTASLDHFVRENSIGPVDFIKIDIQGAELDVFKGGENSLRNTVTIVSEVEFIEHYKNQPLFGDVCAYLDSLGFMYHKILGFGGRMLKPVSLNFDQNYAQHIWSDAIFFRSLAGLDTVSPEQLIKTAIFANLYLCMDVAVYCLMKYDNCRGTQLVLELNELNKTVRAQGDTGA